MDARTMPLRRTLRQALPLALALAATGTGAAREQETPAPPDAGITWVTIPAGTFQMGCVPGDTECNIDERPRHAVTLTKPFQMMATEVTVRMYRSAAAEVEEQPPWSTAPDHPVVIVTWEEARKVCAVLGGRLPTEAEWEFAARGGREGAIYPWGNEPPDDGAKSPHGAAFESDRPMPVRSFPPNGYGLYDMAGNVWEWTEDIGSLYQATAATDPEGLAEGSTRILRGGSFGDAPSNLRVSNRTPNRASRINVNVGFRCAKDLPR
jgi:formylglycine-generating enzyme required for sulfatase activity